MCKYKTILTYAFIFNDFRHIKYEAIFPYKINYKYNNILLLPFIHLKLKI